ncbi:TerS protein [Pusillimonas sp. ANT_WB101]|uniref:TerS protein n=1 Tax=Pusillimonas sp. ANT_WB101 TaxID=2597356 RepID=UPI0011EBEB0A|nr:TerS protein [Pusillimonas sp. ANT_WB101]KAA0893072.1 TerS protein [Pusillimonas sp. ANT_WB101]
MTRRTRSDSAKAAVQASQNAARGPLSPPSHVALPADAKPFWDAVMLNRPRDRWNDADLAMAAVMARDQAAVERLQREIAIEGDVLDGKLNPKHKLVETLARRVVAMARAIHVHAEATTGRSQNQGKALELERQANQEEDDDLIPTLRAVK